MLTKRSFPDSLESSSVQQPDASSSLVPEQPSLSFDDVDVVAIFGDDRSDVQRERDNVEFNQTRDYSLFPAPASVLKAPQHKLSGRKYDFFVSFEQ